MFEDKLPIMFYSINGHEPRMCYSFYSVLSMCESYLTHKFSEVSFLFKTKGIWQDSLDQCPMSINADQNSGIDPSADQCQIG